MPQRKKSGSSARSPAADGGAAPQAGSAQRRREPPAPNGSSRSGSAGDASAAARAPGAASADAPASGRIAGEREARPADDQLMAAIASLRDVLSQGVVITADRLQETVDDSVRRGRMTAQDAEELVQNLVAIGRRQSQDAFAEIERVLGRSAKETRRIARERVKDVGTAARRAPGTDRALRTVDRVRRAAGLGPAFPIIGYDDLTATQVIDRLGELNPPELRKVRDHERRNANRKSVLAAIERSLR